MLNNRRRSSRLQMVYFGESWFFLKKNQMNKGLNEIRKETYFLPRRFRKPVMVFFEFLTSCCRA